MPQIDESFSSMKPRAYKTSQNVSVAVPQTGNTTILEMKDIPMTTRLGVHIVVAGFALDAFRVSVKFHPGGVYMLIASVPGDYTVPTGLMIDASGDLTILAVGANGWFILDTTGVNSVLVEASSVNVVGSTVSVYAGAS